MTIEITTTDRNIFLSLLSAAWEDCQVALTAATDPHHYQAEAVPHLHKLIAVYEALERKLNLVETLYRELKDVYHA